MADIPSRRLRSGVADGVLPAWVDLGEVDKLMAVHRFGIPAIDAQHRILFGWYVALRRAPDLREVLRALHAYAGTHFGDELRWAARHGADQDTLDAHGEEHDTLLHRIATAMTTSRTSRSETMALAYDWLTVHIDVSDRAMVAGLTGQPSGTRTAVGAT